MAFIDVFGKNFHEGNVGFFKFDTDFLDRFTFADVENYLFTISPFPQNTVKFVRFPDPASDMVGMTYSDAMNMFARGDTLILNALHLRLPSIAYLAGELGRALDCEIRVNAYITPPDSAGFAKHYDHHDVLILQTSGKKEWRIYQRVETTPVETTFMSSHQKAAFSSLSLHRDDVPDQYSETTSLGRASHTLIQNDCLFLPRGTPHAGQSLDMPSIHLSVSPIIPTAAETISLAVLRNELTSELGRELYNKKKYDISELECYREQLQDIDALLEIDRQRMRKPLPGEYLNSLVLLDKINVKTKVEWRPNLIPWIGSLNGREILSFHDQVVDVVKDLAPAFKFVANTPRFLVKELPLPDDDQRASFVKELIKLGLLQCSETI